MFFVFQIIKNHFNNSSILGKLVRSSKQDILEEGSLTQATMATEHSSRTSTNTFGMKAPEPSRGPAYTPSNSRNIPSPHIAIPPLYQTQNVHHTVNAKKIHCQGKQIMGEGEKFEAAYSPNMDCQNLYSREGFSSGLQVPKLTKYDGEGCPHTHLWTFCNEMFQLDKDEGLLIHLFSESLEDHAVRWFMNL